MNAEQTLATGDIDGALADLQGRVKKAPADPKPRVFLFQLLALAGQWERALTQLNVAGELDSANLAMVNTYREALRCEVFRAQVFSGEREPLLFGAPEPWMALLTEALRLAAQDRIEQSQTLREQAFAQAPATAGAVDEQPFAWIADADQRLGPMLEAIINGRYYLVPFHALQELVLEAPVDLRDLIWTPAHITWTNQGQTVALIPTRYPGSEASTDNRIRMARRTEWLELGADLFRGLGQRMLTTDTSEYPLLETKRIRLTSPPNPTA
ncbi:MAG: virulence protein SciE type [Candidatus Thiosymbion ectosymbiont of Robbea hypermnestra]|nr:virulence protein SciE type [Candidatus Thiosymbion ectosymbiont of Robbea hypermnestra]